MRACFLFPFQNEYDGYMLKQIVFGSFYHPFQDGYKSSVIQILFPWLVQCYIGIDLDLSKPKGMPSGLKLHTYSFTTKYIYKAKA